MLLFRRFRRGIHLLNVHNGGPALEGLQVSHPQNGISVSTPQFSTPLHLACVGIEKSALSLHLSLSTSLSTVSPPPSVPSLSSPLCLRRPLAGREINTCLPYWKFHQSWAKSHLHTSAPQRYLLRRLASIAVSITTFTWHRDKGLQFPWFPANAERFCDGRLKTWQTTRGAVEGPSVVS